MGVEIDHYIPTNLVMSCIFRNDVAFVEIKGVFECFLRKPDFSISIEQTLIEIIRYSTSVLYFANHITEMFDLLQR